MVIPTTNAFIKRMLTCYTSWFRRQLTSALSSLGDMAFDNKVLQRTPAKKSDKVLQEDVEWKRGRTVWGGGFTPVEQNNILKPLQNMLKNRTAVEGK